MDDVTDSENKVYGSLLIPKGLLGADMEGSGLSNGGSLTEMNTTYARRIKRIQIALQTGLETLLNIFAISEGLQRHVGKFKVRLTPIITVEDNRRDELLQNKIRNVNDMTQLVSNIESIDEDTKLDMLISWLSKYLNQQDIVEILNQHIKQLEKEETEKKREEHENQIDGDSDIGNFSGGSNSFSDVDLDTDFDTDEGTDMDTDTEETTTEEEPIPTLSDQENLADIEGQDLL